jgi:hypothetical protein
MPRKKVGRREAIGVMGAASAAVALGCSDSSTSPTSTSSSNSTCAVTPEETAGPFPSLTDLFRADIRDGKAGSTL